MSDYIKRFMIAVIMALCVSLLFLGGKHSKAASIADENFAKRNWIWPADGVISDTYGTRKGNHKGIDIAGELKTPVLAVEDGVVIKSYYSNSYGNVVFIKHPSHFVTVYAHLHKRLVTKGQSIQQGDTIGQMGETGQATGIHLHFETHEVEWRYDKKFALDPERLLGRADIGDAVQGGIASVGNGVIEASTRFHTASERPTSYSKYVVRNGDTLYSISRKVHVSVERLKEMNHLKSDLIVPKQILTVN